MPIVAPSFLAIDFADVKSETEMVNRSRAEWLNTDVMDGVFVPNISYGASIVKTIRRLSEKFIDAHLMIVKPERYLENFKEAGANSITVHLEACDNLHHTLSRIKDLGCKAGAAINPQTSVHLLEKYIREIDVVCVMAVNPGFAGQQLMEHTYHKIAELKKVIHAHHSKALIQVDGGVDKENAKKLTEAGADVLVAGSFIFNSSTPEKEIEFLYSLKT